MKIRNSSRITALILVLMMIVPLISIPTIADEQSTSIQNNTTVSTPAYSEDFQDGTLADNLYQYPYASELEYGIGDSDSIAVKVELKATWETELAVVYTDRSGALAVTAVAYADGRAWTGIANYDGSAVKVTTSLGSGITGVITTVATATNNINSCTVVTDNGTYTKGKTLAIVEGAVANAIAGNCGSSFATIAREAYAKNPEIPMTDEKVFVLEADYYISSDFSATIEGRVYGDAGQIDLFNIAPSGNNVTIKKHSDCVDVKNGATGVTVPKGNWYNIKFVIDATQGYPTIHCFVNDTFAFTTNESANLADTTLTTLNANQWNLGHVSRGVKASTLTGYWAVDNANIYTSTAGMKLALWSNDVDSASTIGDIFYSTVPGNKISIDSTTFAGTDHGDVIAWDNVPYADGSYWLYTGSGHFNTGNNIQIPKTSITVTNGLATGSVTVGGTTYYFKDATVCTTSRTQNKATMYTDEACTTEASGTYYICDGAVVTAYTGGLGGNIATPSLISKGQTGQKFTVSADYNFGTDLAMKGMDIRLHSPNVHMFSIGATTASATTVTVKMHGDLTSDANVAKGNKVYVNNTLTISKGEWHNFTVTFDSTDENANGGTLITGYVDGQLVGKVYMANSEMTQIVWNVGHTVRNGNVGDNKGHWYVDNFAIYYGNVIPEAWTEEKDSSILYEENFELLGKEAVGSNIYYNGTLYSTADIDGNKALKIDSDTLPDDSVQANGTVANLDKNLFAAHPAIDAATYNSVVFEAAYYLEPNSRQQIEAQFRQVTATYNTTFGGTAETTGTANYVQLYTICHKEDYAYFANFGSSEAVATAKTTYYNTTCPTGRWFTVSTVVNVDTGAMSFYVDGVLAAETYMYAANGVTGWLTNMTILAGGSNNGFTVAKLNSLKGTGSTQVGWNSTWPKGYSGYFMVDDVKVYTGTEPKNVANGISVDFEDAAYATDKTVTSAGQIKNGNNTISNSGNTVSQVAPSLATYTNELAGNWAVKFSMKGATAETKLDVPFLAGFNSRAYDLTAVSDGTWTPVASGKVTWDLIEGDVLTKTGSISGTNDKPLYYYWDGSNTVHVYNNNGNAVTESTVGSLTYTKYTLTDANYNGMIRAMCGGADANIDKNFYLTTPALTAAGTYVLSADYYIPEDAGGIVQSQMYTNWVDLYRFDLTNKKFNSANSGTVVGDLIVNAWNNVTMIVTVAEGKDVVFDIYLNGVYTHTITRAGYTTIKANDWIVFKAQKPVTIGIASQFSGNVYVDNVQFNAVEYNAEAIKSVDITNASAIKVWGNTINVIGNAAKKVNVYAPNGYGVVAASEAFTSFAGIVTTTNLASIRIDDPTGLRFATEMNTELYAQLLAMVESGDIAAVSYGTLIAPLDDGYRGAGYGTELTHDIEWKLDVACANYYIDIDDNDATEHFVGSIVNIYESNLTRAFTGRGYVKITLNNGGVVYIYSETVKTISVAQQAQNTIDAGSMSPSDVGYDIVAGFAAALNN